MNISIETIATAITTYIQTEFMYAIEGVDLQPDTLLVEYRIVDSIGIFRLVAFLEEEFDLEIEATDVIPEHFSTIDAMTTFVASKMEA